LEDFTYVVSLLGKHKDKKILVYSRSGYQSELACEILLRHRFKNVINLKKGLFDWNSKGWPITEIDLPDDVHKEVYLSLINDLPVFLFFYNPEYIDHYKEQMKIVNKLRLNYKFDIHFININGKAKPDIIESFDVRVYPTMYLVVNHSDLGFLYVEFDEFKSEEYLDDLFSFITTSDSYATGLYKWQRSLLIHHRLPTISIDVGKQIVKTGESFVMIKFRESMIDDYDENVVSIKNLGLINTAELRDWNMIAGYALGNVYNDIKKSPDVEEIYLDYKFSAMLDESLDIINFPEAYNDFGLTGAGIKICIIDTGIDDFFVNYSYGYDFVNNDTDPFDDHGHGTKVAMVMDAIAPDAEIIVAKVLDDNGYGHESLVIQGLEWAIAQNPDIIHFSIGSNATSSGFCDTDFVANLSNQAVDMGIFVTAASGNKGSVNLSSPACGSKVFSVGATDDFDNIANFSNVNPTLDIFAPGVNITTATGTASGTSLSAPHVSASIALLLEYETLSISEVKYRLKSTGRSIEYIFNESLTINISRLDLYNILQNNITMEPYDSSNWWHADLVTSPSEEGGVYGPLSCPCCFLPGTLINLADGSYKNIEDIEIGDLVKVFNEKTGKVEDAPVSSIQIKVHDDVHELHLEDGSILKPTANHPFLTTEKGWATIDGLDDMHIGSKQIEIGDHVHRLNKKGTIDEIKVIDIIPLTGEYLTYSFIDMKYETFLAEDVVTHNCCFLPGTQVNLADNNKKNIEAIEIGDVVKVFNEETQEVEDAPVSSIQILLHDDVHEIHLENGNILTPTSNHPFLTAEKGWSTISGLDEMGMGAEILEVGDHVYQYKIDGVLEETQILDIIPIKGDYLTYNLVDMEYGTYLVEDIITHNTCFLPGTQINLADGTYKEIEKIEIGNVVKVFDEQNQSIKQAPVTSLQTKIHDDVHELILEDGTTLQPTANHPFYTLEKGWATISGLDEMGMNSELLEIGDTLYQLQPNGTLKQNQITNIIPIQGNYLTYNLIDMKYGTYLTEDIITHNSCFLPGTQVNLANGSYKNIEEIEIGEILKVFDEETQTVENVSVSSLQVNLQNNIYELYLEDDIILHPSANHPFLTQEKGWATISGLDEMGMNSGLLEVGDTLYQLQSNGKIIEKRVINIIEIEGSYLTYNLVDMQYGTYLTEGIITHNTCFLPGTQINLANGSYKLIEDIKSGDLVKVFNDKTKQVEDSPVKSIYANIHYDLYKLYLENGKVLNVTSAHPFWTKEKGWADIEGYNRLNIGTEKIEIGDHVLSLRDDGSLEEIEVIGISPLEGGYYAITLVDMKYETFLAEDIVTHNSCFLPGAQVNLANGSYKNIEDIEIGDMVKVFKEGDAGIDEKSANIIQSIIKDDIYEIILENGDILRRSATHPFKTIENKIVTISGMDGSGDYCEILEIGDHITQLNQNGDIEYAQVVDLIPIEGVFEMYTFLEGIPAGTQIMLIDGTNKNVEDLEIGDIIFSIDFETSLENYRGFDDFYEQELKAILPEWQYEDKKRYFKKLYQQLDGKITINSATIIGIVKQTTNTGVYEINNGLTTLTSIGDKILTPNNNYETIQTITYKPGTITSYTLDTTLNDNTIIANGILIQNTNLDQVENIIDTIETAPVTSIQKLIHNDVHELILDDGTILQPTANHPFYTKEKGWATISGLDEMGMNSGLLEIGDTLYQLQTDGTLKGTQIANIIPIQGNYLTYNLVDMETGTYLVDDIVTHNSCFLPGTQINLANGTYKAIEDVQVGEMVKVFNEQNQTVEDAPVASIEDGIHYDCFELHLENGKILSVTAAHPFWTKERGWADIEGLNSLNLGTEKLELGDHIYQYNKDGTLEEIKVIDIVSVEGGYYAITLRDMKYETFLAEDIITHNSCFLPGALVNTANNCTKNIEDIEIGDVVKIFKEETQKVEDAPVSSIQIKIHNDVHELILDDGTILQPTANHPLLTKEKGWATISGLDEMGMNSAKLEINDHVYQLQTDGTLKETQITNIIPIQGNYLTYNLVDMETGTYLVDNIVTHNTCFLPGTQINLANGTYKNIEDLENGDMIKVFDENTEKIVNEPVKSVSGGIHTDLYELSLENGKVLNVTSAHPFWTKEKGWADIGGCNALNLNTGKLEIGDHVYELNKNGDLEEIKVTGFSPIDGSYFALTVVDMTYETFLAEDIVTHNSFVFCSRNRNQHG